METPDKTINGGHRPVPDPTVLTTQQLEKAVEAERDYVEGQLDVLRQRLKGIDTATELLRKGIDDIPRHVDSKVTHLASLTDERFISIAKQFAERDTRSERESRDNKVAVDAAFAAQKEAASEQNKSNTLAITKSEVATTETINKLAELFRTTTDGLGGQIADLKERTTSGEQRAVGKQEVKAQQSISNGMIISIVGILAASLMAGAGIIAAVLG